VCLVHPPTILLVFLAHVFSIFRIAKVEPFFGFFTKRKRKLSKTYQQPLWIIVDERWQVIVTLGDGVFILFFGEMKDFHSIIKIRRYKSI
jgi:hypothetical protein